MKTLLIIIRFAVENSTRSHTVEYVPRIKTCLDRLSLGGGVMAFSSPDGVQFGYFIRTETPLRTIRSTLCGTGTRGGASLLLTGDSVLILSVGGEFDGSGFSKAWTWLQHHHEA